MGYLWIYVKQWTSLIINFLFSLNTTYKIHKVCATTLVVICYPVFNNKIHIQKSLKIWGPKHAFLVSKVYSCMAYCEYHAIKWLQTWCPEPPPTYLSIPVIWFLQYYTCSKRLNAQYHYFRKIDLFFLI